MSTSTSDLGPMGTATSESLREVGLPPPCPPAPPRPLPPRGPDDPPRMDLARVLRLSIKPALKASAAVMVPFLVVVAIHGFGTVLGDMADDRAFQRRRDDAYARAFGAHQLELDDMKREMLRAHETAERLRRFILTHRQARRRPPKVPRGITGVANVGAVGLTRWPDGRP